MLKLISAAGIALAMAATPLAFTHTASAQDVELRIGPDGIRPVIRDNTRRDRCGPREARAAARDSGLRDPQIVRVTERRVVVEGVTRRGGVARITFANLDGCPEV